MKHRVETLEGAQLDAAAAEAEGLPLFCMKKGWPGNARVNSLACEGPVVIRTLVGELWVEHQGKSERWSPSSVWSQGGPILEREALDVTVGMHSCDGIEEGNPPSHIVFWMADRDGIKGYGGPTVLIAAMRAFVASKFGEEVEL